MKSNQNETQGANEEYQQDEGWAWVVLFGAFITMVGYHNKLL